jgi:hypothetical protein
MTFSVVFDKLERRMKITTLPSGKNRWKYLKGDDDVEPNMVFRK